MGARTISPKLQIHEHPGGTAHATCSDGVFLQHAGGPRWQRGTGNDVGWVESRRAGTRPTNALGSMSGRKT
jgi:hypothetical protein